MSPAAAQQVSLSLPVSQALRQEGILRELPSHGKAHVYAYDRYMEILNAEEGV